MKLSIIGLVVVVVVLAVQVQRQERKLDRLTIMHSELVDAVLSIRR